jgi:hypothetical protein
MLSCGSGRIKKGSVAMSMMKAFVEQVSQEMGFGGEINDEVIAAATARLESGIDHFMMAVSKQEIASVLDDLLGWAAGECGWGEPCWQRALSLKARLASELDAVNGVSTDGVNTD